VEPALAELRRRLAEVEDLNRVIYLLDWDQQVMMPRGGAAVRAEQLATVQRLAHQLFTDDEVGRLLDELRPIEESLPFESDDASLIRVARRDWEKQHRVPTELAAEMAKLSSEGMVAWAAAREAGDYAAFRPWLDRTLELKHRYIDCFPAPDEIYDILLDDFEPGLTTGEVRTVFDRLRAAIVPLVDAVATDEVARFMAGPFPQEAQRALSLEAIRAFGYDDGAFRLDLSVHPFCTSLGVNDVRLTTRFEEGLESLFSSMHECGHGLYEHGVAPALERTPLGTGASMALHESQSRLWENVVGRSLPFWRWFWPQTQSAFPEALDGVGLDDFHRAINRVRRSYIRVSSDEVTYGLHIILRFELEQELLSGQLATADLPDAWNARFEELIGTPVPDDRVGCLQDIHWSGGAFGYFPSYQLGNVISVQIWDKARTELGDLDDQLERGSFGDLHEWLRETLYRHGRKFTTPETLQRVVGTGIDPEPYLHYLQTKFGSTVTA
jgi:carboxypeptidase Taq